MPQDDSLYFAHMKVFSYAPTLEADQVQPLALLDQPVAMPI